MTIYDIVIIIAIGGLAVWGWLRGFFREMVELIGLIAGVILAVKLAMPVGAAFLPAGWLLVVKTTIAASLILIVTVVGIRLIGWAIHKALVRGPLKLMDRVIGASFGALKGCLLVFAILVVVSLSPFSRQLEETSADSPVLRAAIAVTNPVIRRYGDRVFSKINESIVELLPGKLTPPDSDTKHELAAFMRKISSSSSESDQKKAVQELSPKAKDYLKRISGQLSELDDIAKASGKEAVEAAPDIDWMKEKIDFKKLSKSIY